MGSAQRINSKLVIAAVIGGLALIGWVSRNTRAQNSPVSPKLPQVAPLRGEAIESVECRSQDRSTDSKSI